MTRSKKMKVTTAVAIVTFAVLAAAAVPVMAQRSNGHHGREMGPGGPGGGADIARVVLRHVDLTDDQRDAIREVARSAREGRTDEDRQAFRQARHEMVQVMWSLDATEADVQAAAARVAAMEQAEVLDQFRVTRAILGELTPEQQAQVQEFLANPPEPREHRGNGRPGDDS